MDSFDFEAEKGALLENLQHLKSLEVEDYTFQKKWDEIQDKVEIRRNAIHNAREALWKPRDFDDEALTIAHIENLKPKIIIADDAGLSKLWELYRLFGHSGEYNQTPGRFIKFFVVDTNVSDTGTAQHPECLRYDGFFKEVARLHWPILGLGAVSGDFPAIACRDKFIGWTKEQRENGKLNHTAVGSTIAPTQPFGYNFNGGKLIAALITSKAIRNEWQLQYGDVLAGMTTTSLYGAKSMYDELKWWEPIGVTTGRVPIQPKGKIYDKWLQYVKRANAKEFRKMMKQDEDISGPVTNYKTKVLTMIFKTVGISLNDFTHGYERGVYFSSFYENTKEFLCGNANESELKLKPLFEDDVNAIMEWWRPMALLRYKIQKKRDKLKPKPFFYNHLGEMDFETAKECFRDDVGR